MKNLNEVQVGDEVVYVNGHYSPGKIVKVEARTPTGRLRIGSEYFEPNTAGDYAWKRGRNLYPRCNLKPVTPDLRRAIMRHEAIEFLSNASKEQWAKLSDIDLLTIKINLKNGGQIETKNTGSAPTNCAGEN
jgi:hypothetical protein